MRYEQRKEMQAVPPEADDQNDREAENGQDAGYAELAGDRERMPAGDDGKRQQSGKGRTQDEGEERKDVGDELPALRADVHLDHVVDEASEAFHSHLPPAGHQLSLQP